jgi:hypothetical protein
VSRKRRQELRRGRGYPKPRPDIQNKGNKVEMERVLRYVKETVLPKIKMGSFNPA